MIVDSILRVKIPELSKREWEALESRLTFVLDNGDVVQTFRRQVWVGNYILPRGAWNMLPGDIRYRDKRTCPKMPTMDYKGTLNAIEKDPRYEGQSECVETMLREEQGLIIRPPGTGKTEIALAFAAQAETRTLVIVHTEDILQQWIERIEQLIPDCKPGVVRGKTQRVGQITVATVQTLQRFISDPDWFAQFGATIVDEAHHVSAPTWEGVINVCTSRYRFGFTASATRADGMHPTMKFLIGPVIHKQKFSSPIKLTVDPVKTKFRFRYRGAFDWHPLLDALISDDERNQIIAERVAKDIEDGNSVLVLSRRIEHLERIAALIPHPTEILAAKLKSKTARRSILQKFRSGELSCVLATQLADEALDVPRLSRVHLTHPGKHEGRIIQQIGRAIRKHPEKQDAVITDYVDDLVGPLKNQWRLRKRTYQSEKITVNGTGRILPWRM